MKYVIFIITCIMVIQGLTLCKEFELYKDDSLSITKEDYTGNQLNIRGYYYSNPEKDNDSKAYVFFSNGTFLQSYGDYDSLQMGLVNWSGTEIRKDDPVFWGAYNITGSQIIMEKWDIGKCG